MLMHHRTLTIKIVFVATLITLACRTIQINVQVNIGLTPTATSSITNPTSSSILQTPTITDIPLTSTVTSTPEMMPRLMSGQPVDIQDLFMLGETTGWAIGADTSILNTKHILHTLDEG